MERRGKALGIEREEEDSQFAQAIKLVIEKGIAHGLSDGGTVGLMIPFIEIDGEMMGPFNIIVQQLASAPDPEVADVAVVMRAADVPEGDRIAKANAGEVFFGECPLCENEVMFKATVPAAIPKVCLQCFTECGPQGVGDALEEKGYSPQSKTKH